MSFGKIKDAAVSLSGHVVKAGAGAAIIELVKQLLGPNVAGRAPRTSSFYSRPSQQLREELVEVHVLPAARSGLAFVNGMQDSRVFLGVML